MNNNTNYDNIKLTNIDLSNTNNESALANNSNISSFLVTNNNNNNISNSKNEHAVAASNANSINNLIVHRAYVDIDDDDEIKQTYRELIALTSNDMTETFENYDLEEALVC